MGNWYTRQSGPEIIREISRQPLHQRTSVYRVLPLIGFSPLTLALNRTPVFLSHLVWVGSYIHGQKHLLRRAIMLNWKIYWKINRQFESFRRTTSSSSTKSQDLEGEICAISKPTQFLQWNLCGTRFLEISFTHPFSLTSPSLPYTECHFLFLYSIF